MYKTLDKYSNQDHYPYETYQRYIAQYNRQLQALASNARKYELQKWQGNITHKNKFYHGLKSKPKNTFCSKN
jgi:hypothetical protein